MFNREGVPPYFGLKRGTRVFPTCRLGGLKKYNIGHFYFGTTPDMEDWEERSGVGTVADVEVYENSCCVAVSLPSGFTRNFHPFELTIVED